MSSELKQDYFCNPRCILEATPAQGKFWGRGGRGGQCYNYGSCAESHAAWLWPHVLVLSCGLEKFLQRVMKPRWVLVTDRTGICWFDTQMWGGHGHIGHRARCGGTHSSALCLLAASSCTADVTWEATKGPSSACHPRTWCSWEGRHSDNEE